MTQLGYAFDPSTAPQDDRNFDPLPSGWYDAQIIESDVMPTKNGNGTILKLTWEVISGPFTNRKLWMNLNIQNANAMAQEIAQKQLRGICEAVSFQGVLQDSKDLEFKPCQVKVGIDKDDATRNAVQSARQAVSGVQHGRPQQQPASQRQSAPPPQQAAGGGSRPWAKRA